MEVVGCPFMGDGRVPFGAGVGCGCDCAVEVEEGEDGEEGDEVVLEEGEEGVRVSAVLRFRNDIAATFVCVCASDVAEVVVVVGWREKFKQQLAYR